VRSCNGETTGKIQNKTVRWYHAKDQEEVVSGTQNSEGEGNRRSQYNLETQRVHKLGNEQMGPGKVEWLRGRIPIPDAMSTRSALTDPVG